MAGEETVLLRDVCVKIGSGATPRGGKEAYKGGATSLIRSQNIYNEGFHRDGLVYIDDDQSAELRNVEVKPNDVLLNITGDSVARCCQVAVDVLPARVNQHVAIIRPQPNSLDARFLRYILVSNEYQSRLLALASAGATRPALTKSMIEELNIPSPPLAEQKDIAAVLGALDDKIELNRRMNATLEAMVRALFQCWFSDFDPVRTNLEIMDPVGVSKTSTALFPAHLEDSPLGKVPVGWRVLKFADILTPHSVRVGEDTVPEFSATVTGLSSRDERFKKQLSKYQSKNKRIVEGDLVFGFSREVINFGLMRESVGAVSPVYEVFKINSSKIEPELLERLFRFNMPYYIDILKPGAREGKPIDRDYLLRKHLLVPDMAVQRSFLAKIQPWEDKIKANETESRTLATLRDTLLPKLLSGELPVPSTTRN